MITECHEHFLDDHLEPQICHNHGEEEEQEEKSHPTSAQSIYRIRFIFEKNVIISEYGYGFLAVFVISVLSLGGLLAFPCIYKISFQYILVTFTALAVGTLFGDALFHLIPFVCIHLLYS